MDKGFQVEASVCFASLWLYFDGYAITDAHVPHEKLRILIMLIMHCFDIFWGVSIYQTCPQYRKILHLETL